MTGKILSLGILLLVSLAGFSCAGAEPGGAVAGGLERQVAPVAPVAEAPGGVATAAGQEAADKPAPVGLTEQRVPFVARLAETSGPGQPAPPSETLKLPPAPTRDIRLGQPEPALTETLDRALAMLEKERAESQRLKQTITLLEQQLADRGKTIAELSAQMESCAERAQTLELSLEQWKRDVLGFRDEMRQAEEAEIEVLQQILIILKSFQKEKELE